MKACDNQELANDYCITAEEDAVHRGRICSHLETNAFQASGIYEIK
jgi:hypothetical protein